MADVTLVDSAGADRRHRVEDRPGAPEHHRESGPGNLLGNLLCAVAGLLDGPSFDLNGLIAILAALGGL